MNRRPPAFLFVALLAILLLPTCSSATPTATRPPAQTLRIISGSENQTLEPLLQEYARRSNPTIEMTYKGSVDIMLELERGSVIPYDAVWPANSLWIALGDKQGVVKAQESI